MPYINEHTFCDKTTVTRRLGDDAVAKQIQKRRRRQNKPRRKMREKKKKRMNKERNKTVNLMTKCVLKLHTCD
jgi:hypothetical protein